MTEKMLTIWTNAKFPEAVERRLAEGAGPHRLLHATERNTLNLASSPRDAGLDEADVAFGQPHAGQVMEATRLGWVHLTSAGYTNYDRDEVRAALRARGARLTTSSAVYDDPCAQHVLAMMMAEARQLPASVLTQAGDRGWPSAERRRRSRLLTGQSAVLLGFGAIAVRLTELLAPFRMNLVGVRRRVAGDEPIEVVALNRLDEYLPSADHVVNLLPGNASTVKLVGRREFERMKPGAVFYNIGRGVTVDQEALCEALRAGRLAAAYLDVTDPEPLPPHPPLWGAPNCHLTPHSAGGQDREMEDLVEHFLDNLRRFASGEALLNQVI